jgi:circadian clock protein KaiC
VPPSGVVPLAEVMVLMRYVELRSRLYRLISLVKVREDAFDPTIREFTIGNAGVVVGKPFEGVEGILSGMAREVTKGGTAVPSGDNQASSGAGTGRSG